MLSSRTHKSENDREQRPKQADLAEQTDGAPLQSPAALAKLQRGQLNGDQGQAELDPTFQQRARNQNQHDQLAPSTGEEATLESERKGRQNGIGSLFDQASGLLQSPMDSINQGFDTLEQRAGKVVDRAEGALQTPLDRINQGFSVLENQAGSMTGGLSGIAEKPLSSLNQGLGKIEAGATGAVDSAEASIQGALGNLNQGLNNAEAFAQSVMDNIGDLQSSLFGALGGALGGKEQKDNAAAGPETQTPESTEAQKDGNKTDANTNEPQGADKTPNKSKEKTGGFDLGAILSGSLGQFESFFAQEGIGEAAMLGGAALSLVGAGPLNAVATGIATATQIGVRNLMQEKGFDLGIDTGGNTSANQDLAPKAPGPVDSQRPPVTSAPVKSAPVGDPQRGADQAPPNGARTETAQKKETPRENTQNTPAPQESVEKSVAPGTPLNVELQGQTAPPAHLRNFESNAPRAGSAPTGATPVPATGEARTLLDAQGDLLRKPENTTVARSASELGGAKNKGSIVDGNTGVHVDAGAAHLGGHTSVGTHIQSHGNDTTPIGAAPVVEGSAEARETGEPRNTALQTPLNLNKGAGIESGTLVGQDTAVSDVDASGNPTSTMPTFTEVSDQTPEYPGGDDHLPRVSSYAPNTPDLSRDLSAVRETLATESAPKDRLKSDALGDLQNTIGPLRDQANQQFTSTVDGPTRDLQNSVDQSRTQLLDLSAQGGAQAGTALQEALAAAQIKAGEEMKKAQNSPLPSVVVGGNPDALHSTVSADHDAMIGAMIGEEGIQFQTPDHIEALKQTGPVELDTLIQGRDPGLGRYQVLDNTLATPEPQFDPNATPLEDLLDPNALHLHEELTALDVDLTPPDNLSFPRANGDPIAGPAAIDEVQARIVEEAATQMPQAQQTWEDDLAQRMSQAHQDHLGDVQSQYDTAQSEASGLLQTYETSTPDLDPQGQLLSAQQTWTDAKTNAQGHRDELQVNLDDEVQKFHETLQHEQGTFQGEQDQAVGLHRDTLQGHQQTYTDAHLQAQTDLQNEQGSALGDLQVQQESARLTAQAAHAAEQAAYQEAIQAHETEFEHFRTEATSDFEARRQETDQQFADEIARLQSEADTDMESKALDIQRQIQALEQGGSAEVNQMLEQGRQEYQSEIDAGVAQAEETRRKAESEADAKRDEDKGVLERVGDAISSVLDWIADLFSEAREAIQGFLERAKESAMNKLQQWRQKAMEKLAEMRDGISDMIASGAAWMKEKVSAVSAAVQNLIAEGSRLLNTAVQGLTDILNAGIEGFRQGINLLSEGFLATVALVDQDLSEDLRQASAGYLERFNQATTQAQSRVQAASTQLQEGITASAQTLQDSVKQSEQGMLQRIDNAEVNLQAANESLYEGAVIATNAVFDAAEVAVEQGFELTQAAVDAYFDIQIGLLRAASKTIDAISEWAQERLDEFSEWAEEAWGQLKEALSEAWLAVEEAFVSFWNSPWRDVVLAVGLTALAIVVTVVTAGAGAPLLVSALAAGAAAGTAAAATYGAGEIGARRANIDLMQNGRQNWPGRTLEDPVTGQPVPDPTDPANQWYVDTMGSIRRHPNGGLSYQDESGEWVEVDPTDPNAAMILAEHGFARGDDGQMTGESLSESAGAAGTIAAQKGAEYFVNGAVVGLTAGAGGGMLGGLSSTSQRIGALGATYYASGNVTQTASGAIGYMMDHDMGFGEAMGEVWDDRTHKREAMTNADGQVVGYGRGEEYTAGEHLLREGGSLAGSMLAATFGAAGRRPMMTNQLPDNLFNMTMRQRMTALGLDTVAGVAGDVGAYGIDMLTGRETWQGWDHMSQRIAMSAFSNSAGGLASGYAQHRTQSRVVEQRLAQTGEVELQQRFSEMPGRQQEAMYELLMMGDQNSFHHVMSDDGMRTTYAGLPNDARSQFLQDVQNGLPPGQRRARLEQLGTGDISPWMPGVRPGDDPDIQTKAADDTRDNQESSTLTGSTGFYGDDNHAMAHRQTTTPVFARRNMSQARKRLSPEARQEFDALVSSAENQAQRSMMEKALGAGGEVAEIRQLRQHMSGMSEQEVIQNFTGAGIFQHFMHSCVPTSYQVARAEADPIYAYKLQSDPVLQAQEQAIALQATGGATIRRSDTTSGRIGETLDANPSLRNFYDDAKSFSAQGSRGIEPNSVHRQKTTPATGLDEATGRQYEVHTQRGLGWKDTDGVGGSFDKDNLPFDRIDAAIEQGLPVPFSQSVMNAGHEMVIVGSFKQDDKTMYVVHDPMNGGTTATDLRQITGTFALTSVTLPRLTMRERLTLNFVRGSFTNAVRNARRRLFSRNKEDESTRTGSTETGGLDRPDGKKQVHPDPSSLDALPLRHRATKMELSTSNGKMFRDEHGTWRTEDGRLVDNSTVQIAMEIYQNRAINDAMRVYQDRDLEVAALIDTMAETGQPIFVESVAIGAGWASVANANTNPLKGQFESSGLPKHLTLAASDDPWLTRNEMLGQTAGELEVPGLSSQPIDYTATVGEFAPSRAFAAAVAETRASSGMRTYQSFVKNIEPAPAGSPGQYKITVQAEGKTERIIFTNSLDLAAGPGPARKLGTNNIDAESSQMLVQRGVLRYGDAGFQGGDKSGKNVLVYGGGASGAWGADKSQRDGGNVDWFARASGDVKARLDEIDAQLANTNMDSATREQLLNERRTFLTETIFGGSNVARNQHVLNNDAVNRNAREINKIEPDIDENGTLRARVFFKDSDEPVLYDEVIVTIGQDANAPGGPNHLIRNLQENFQAIEDSNGRVLGLESEGVRILGSAAFAAMRNLSAEDAKALQNSLDMRYAEVSANSSGIPVAIEVWAQTVQKLNEIGTTRNTGAGNTKNNPHKTGGNAQIKNGAQDTPVGVILKNRISDEPDGALLTLLEKADNRITLESAAAVLGQEQFSATEASAIIRAHMHGTAPYSIGELHAKLRILRKEGNISAKHANTLMRKGVTGKTDLDTAKNQSFAPINEVKALLDQHNQLKGEFDYEYQNLRSKWDDSAGEIADALQDTELSQLVYDEFKEVQEQAQSLLTRVRERAPKTQEDTIPAYIQENRVARDDESFLVGDEFQRTSIQFHGRTVYKDSKGRHYHMDNLHTGEGSEIEYYNKQGDHLGTLHVDGSPKDGPKSGRKLPGL